MVLDLPAGKLEDDLMPELDKVIGAIGAEPLDHFSEKKSITSEVTSADEGMTASGMTVGNPPPETVKTASLTRSGAAHTVVSGKEGQQGSRVNKQDHDGNDDIYWDDKEGEKASRWKDAFAQTLGNASKLWPRISGKLFKQGEESQRESCEVGEVEAELQRAKLNGAADHSTT